MYEWSGTDLSVSQDRSGDASRCGAGAALLPHGGRSSSGAVGGAGAARAGGQPRAPAQGPRRAQRAARAQGRGDQRVHRATRHPRAARGQPRRPAGRRPSRR